MKETLIFTTVIFQVVLNIYLYYLIVLHEKRKRDSFIAGAILLLFLVLKLEYLQFSPDTLWDTLAWGLYNCSHIGFMIYLFIKVKWK